MHSDDDPETRPGSDRQWWLTQGPEYCFVCEGSMHPEVILHCVACDRALCLMCLAENPDTGEVFCPECRRDQEPEAC